MTFKMGNPGCCCGGCDLLDASFNGWYKVTTITTALANNDDFRASVANGGIGNATRYFEILPGNPGESLVLQQSVNSGGTITWAWLNQQTHIPEFIQHPATGSLDHLPMWTGTSGTRRYRWRIVPPEGELDPEAPTPPAPGYYFWQKVGSGAVTLSGPSSSAPTGWALNTVVAAARGRYWRDHFDMFDEDDSQIIEDDDDTRFPFALRAGEYVVSRKSMPKGWFNIDLTNLILRTWLDSGGTLSVALHDGTDDILRIDYDEDDEFYDLWNDHLNEAVRVECTDLSGAVVDIRRRSSTRFWDAVRLLPRIWWSIRDGHYDVMPESPNGGTIDWYYMPDYWSDNASSNEIHVPLSQSSLPAAGKIRITAGVADAPLSIITASRSRSRRLFHWPQQDENDRPGAKNMNDDCNWTGTCTLVWPYHSPKFELKGASVSDADIIIPDGSTWHRAGCGTRRNYQFKLPDWITTTVIPAVPQGDWYVPDAWTVPRRAQVAWLKSPASFDNEMHLEYFIAEPTFAYPDPESDTHIKVKCEVRFRYKQMIPHFMTSEMWDSGGSWFVEDAGWLGGAPAGWGPGDPKWPIQNWLLQSTDNDLDPVPAGWSRSWDSVNQLWSYTSPVSLHDGGITLIYEKMAPRWEGDTIPLITFAHADRVDFVGDTIYPLATVDGTLSAPWGASYVQAWYEFEGSNHSVDLTTLTFSIGGPS